MDSGKGERGGRGCGGMGLAAWRAKKIPPRLEAEAGTQLMG